MSSGRDEILDKIKHEGGWVPVSKQLLAMPISPSAKLVYVYLLSKSSDWQPSSKDIANGTDLSKNTVTKALIELNEAKMIYTDRTKHGERYLHRFNPDFDFGTETVPEIGTEVSQKLGQSVPEIGTLFEDELSQKLGQSVPEIGTEVSQKLGHTKEPKEPISKNQERGGENSSKTKIPTPPSDLSSFLKNSKNESVKKDVPPFRTMIALLQRETGGLIPKADQIDAFVVSCKDAGVSIEEMSARVFVSAFFDNASGLKKKIGNEKFNSWRENVERQFEQSKAATYFAGTLDMSAEVEGPDGKIYFNRAGQALLDADTFDSLFAGMGDENE